jgi:hypothetical protein
VIFGHGVVTRPEARESKAGSMRIDACDRSPASPKMGKANGIAQLGSRLGDDREHRIA